MDPTDQLLRLEDFSESIPVSGRKEIMERQLKITKSVFFLLFLLFFGPIFLQESIK